MLYSFIFRALWNLFHGRTLLINWYAQIAYALIAIGATYLAYKHLILPKTPLLPDLQTIANELWIIIFLFLYKIFNEIKFQPKFKKKRVDSYISSRLSKFNEEYGTHIDELINTEFLNFKLRVKNYIQNNNNLEEYKFLRHTLLNPFEYLFKILIKDLVFSIMINEDFNRPYLFRKLEKILCKLSRKSYTQGIMQFSSSIPISDEESIKLAIQKIFEDAYRCMCEDEYYLSEALLIISIGRNYNPCDDYISSVEDIYNIIKNSNHSELETFLNDHTLIGLDPSFNLE